MDQHARMVMATITETQKQQSKLLIRQCFEQIVDQVESNQLPEKLFVDNFLPVFSGKVKMEDNNQAIVAWIAIAGSPVASVDIIDSSGKVLFTVPPIAKSDISLKKGTRIADITAHSKLLSQNLPQLGQRYLTEELTGSLVQHRPINVSPEWKAIFDRYGITIDSSTEATDNDDDDDFLAL